MLLTPRTYRLAQVPDAGASDPRPSYFLLTPSRKEQLAEEKRARSMLLLHQTGAVKVGEVVRYTVTYTPSEDRILPPPATLHVKIRNTSALALRAAYLHGPYTLHVAAYPSTFNPNKKVEAPKKDGIPEFEPNVKAGGSWNAKLTVPQHIRDVEGLGPTGTAGQEPGSATWIIEIASQIIFSQSASVNYELLVARDERSLDLGFQAVTGNGYGAPGQVQDHQQGNRAHTSRHSAQPRGVYSKAVKLVVDDTTSLWNKPELPVWSKEHELPPRRKSRDSRHSQMEDARKQKRIHLVLLTHGLHSNLGADMLYLKESIDAAVKNAREERRQRKADQATSKQNPKDLPDVSTAPLSGGQESLDAGEEDDDEEEVVVRGFPGNVIRTERGIQYLGKRLAKYILETTYPDQPFMPLKKSMGQKIQTTFSPAKDRGDDAIPSHAGSSIHHPQGHEQRRAYKYTSISFVGHSLGGIVQTYAVAYIQKHSPQFFDKIQPVNFVTLATPFLGLSNENPMYVRFALDFGLVGRTGKDLGLTWRTPTLAKSGWTAMVSGLGAQAPKDQNSDDPGAKPLLRILPTGPAHMVLRRFRNRTVYSNVVNDGIVPLRTSCLLFLDWRGIGKVDKARRENGLVGTVATWGWGQLTGQNTSPNPSRVTFSEDENEGTASPAFSGDDTTVPQPGINVITEDDEAQAAAEPSAHQFLDGQKRDLEGEPVSSQSNKGTLMTLWGYIRPSGKHTSKDKKMFRRSQTVQNENPGGNGSVVPEASSSRVGGEQGKRPPATRGDSLVNDPTAPAAPPKTTIFESAGDLLSPPVPPTAWIIDPSTRARTIFHDRIYHPEDIPPPPAKRPRYARTVSSEGSNATQSSEQSAEEGGMRVEEKIARAYHKDLSWRKVLVRLEPDAHNNIVVRRMFANAYGWPVIKHLCDTHFADTFSAETRDELEPSFDRAENVKKPVREDGEHVKGQNDTHPPMERTESELREVPDELSPLNSQVQQPRKKPTNDSVQSKDSAMWDDTYFEGTSDDDDDEQDERSALQKFLQLQAPKPKPESPTEPKTPDGVGTSEAEIADFLSTSPTPIEVHRGLGASPRRTPNSQREPDSLESYGGVGGKGKQSPASPQTPSANTTGVGLRTSFEVNSPSSPHEGRNRSSSGGFAEQVARLSLTQDRPS
ncbi:DUF676-domain-containing protein [Polyplosphaeria fusca]|uniref:DUF676-domain-containing protein n=1 Tax=Polyplosphaeria fusca TaxID=682080 RepID=A0A9P4QPB9_9PLEO|nr:DUF676-domain-containing protein [Polyplosphaeria fusca]